MSPDTLSQLIASIYDCALEPSRWEHALREITQATFSESAILSLTDLRRDRVLIEKSVGWGEFGMEERQKHVPEINARLNEWFAKGPSLDEPFIASRQLHPNYLKDSRYVQGCLKPLGIIDIMHQFLVRTPSHFSELVIGRHERQGLITDREVGVMALVLPHVRRTVIISNVLDVRAIESARIAEALDAVSCGVVLTNGEGSILHANRSAEHMLRKGAVLQGSGGILSARAPAAARELRKAIRLAAQDEAMLGRTGLAVCLTGSGEPPLFAHVLPMNGGRLRTQLQPEAAAAIFIGSSIAAPVERTPAETRDLLYQQFGLTKAEADVAIEVLKGDGREAAAARLGIAPTTVRAHLSHIFEKTGVHRQAELIRLLMGANVG